MEVTIICRQLYTVMHKHVNQSSYEIFVICCQVVTIT